MAKIIHGKDSADVSEGESIIEACKSLGVPFSCEEGICGACAIEIIEGEENLSELTEEEKNLKKDKKHRLACMCKIKKGDVKINF